MQNLLPETILQGIPARPHEFPFQAQIHYNNRYICGGAIITPLLIITAAHCLYNGPATNYKIVAGDHDRDSSEGHEQSRSVATFLIHENYIKDKKPDDVGLMLLSSPLVFNSYVNKVNYQKTPHTYSGTATVSGWGRIAADASTSPILLKATVPIMPHKQCEKRRPTILTQNMLCAGEAGRDACSGDSGGPLTAKLTNGGFNLIGLVSFGESCNPRHTLPGVYTNVSKYAAWIHQATRKLMQRKPVVKCKSEQYYCTGTNKCIQSRYTCDGENHCGDYEDERVGKCACESSKWRCPGRKGTPGKCISKAWLCDGDRDCPNGEDEKSCKITKG